MLFNSYVFIYLFLPLTLFGFNYFKSVNGRIQWLILASIFFYGYWDPRFLPLILFSILFNYIISYLILTKTLKKTYLWVGVIANLALIGIFKYGMFISDNLNQLGVTHWEVPDIILPLAISFFTFQQIGYLVDCYHHGKTTDRSFIKYCFFILFFRNLLQAQSFNIKTLFPS